MVKSFLVSMSFFSAVDLLSGELVLPSEMTKSRAQLRTFKCPDCNSKVVFRCGSERKQHFAHFKPNKTSAGCLRYTLPGETTLLKEAKWLLKRTLEKGHTVNVQIRYSCGCFQVNKLPEFSRAVQGPDTVTLKNSKETVCTLKILHVNHTLDSFVEPWYAFSSQDLVENLRSLPNKELVLVTLCDKRVRSGCKTCMDQ